MTHTAKICKSFWGLIIVIALFFVGCQKTPTWQEQYDLGMRYLTESNYEEAILAFTAAIEIDPKQADSYVYLTQVYLSAGNIEMAETIRTQGYEVTGDVRLSQSVKDGWVIYDDSIPFEQRLTYRDFDLLSNDQQETLRQLAAAVQADDRNSARNLLLNGGLPAQLCTIVDGYKVAVIAMQGEEYRAYLDSYNRALKERGEITSSANVIGLDSFISVELRPENGVGFAFYQIDSLIAQIGEEDENFATPAITFELREQFDCGSWQCNGSWERETRSVYAQNSWRAVETGTANNNLITVSTYWHEIEEDGHRWSYTYQNGQLTSIAVDGQTQDASAFPGVSNTIELNQYSHGRW